MRSVIRMKMNGTPGSRQRGFIFFLIFVLASGIVLAAAGCGNSQNAQQPAQSQNAAKKIKIGYGGAACESFIYAAYEKGFFKEEGLDVELVKVDFETLKESLATGKIQASDGMPMKWVKPFEQGIDATFTAGIHTGCFQLLVPKDSGIKSPQDLKGKRIGVTLMGDSPMIFAMRVLFHAGLDTKKDVEWRSYPPTELAGALERGEVDAISLNDPLAQMAIDSGKAVKLVSTAADAPFKDEYCCMATMAGSFIKEDPAGAAAVTRAFMKGAKWVSEHPDEAAQLAVEKKYVPGNPELISKLLKSYNYVPSVEGGQKALDLAITEMKAIGVLEPNTNEADLKAKAFTRIDGVK